MKSVLPVPAGLRPFLGNILPALLSLGAIILTSGCSTFPGATQTDREALRVVWVDDTGARSAAEALAAEHEGDFTLTGMGESMQPVYPPGTVVVVHPTSFFMLRRGMPVVYLNNRGRQVAHLLIEESPAGWIARGLNNDRPDEERVTRANLIGIIRCAYVPEDDRAVTLKLAMISAGSAEHGIALLH